MAPKDRRKCFTFIWKLENVHYCWHEAGESIASPTFIVEEIEESKWKLKLFPKSGSRGNIVGLCLVRLIDKNTVNVEIDVEIALLALNGGVLSSGKFTKKSFGRENFKFRCSLKRKVVFPERSSSFNFGETLIVRCKIWKNIGEISKNVQCTARTHISVLKTSFIWNIKNFSTLELEKNYPYDIKSLEDNRKLISLCLFIKRDQKLFISISSVNQEIKFYTFVFSAVNSSGNTIESLRNEIWCNTPNEMKQQMFSLSKKELVEKKNIYIPNDILSIKCKGTIAFGIASEEIQSISYDCSDFVSDEMDNRCSDKVGIVPVSEKVLTESFKSVLNQEVESPPIKSFMNKLKSVVNNGSLSDVKLKTSNQTYHANMLILSARSPVFRDMFSGETSQRPNDCVNIEDLDDDTFCRILHYIYRSEVEQLQWSSATKLYEGAAKYKILDLKDKCSSHITENLSRTNACEALELAHKHEDANLKDIVQRFIMKKPKSILNSKEWDKLGKKYTKLALETVMKKYKEPSKVPKEKQEELLESQNLPKKRKRAEENSKINNSVITDFFSKSENTHANTVGTNGSSTSHLSKHLTDQKSLEVAFNQEFPSTSQAFEKSEEVMTISITESEEEDM